VRISLLILMIVASVGYTMSDADLLANLAGSRMENSFALNTSAQQRSNVASGQRDQQRPASTRLGEEGCGSYELQRTLPVELATQSKYSGRAVRVTGATMTAASWRAQSIDPIWRAIRTLEPVAYREGDACALKIVAGWARSRALTVASTADAQVTRGRMIAETATLIADLGLAPPIPSDDQAEIVDWLAGIGNDTIDYFETSAGPKTRQNNHRFWAGLALAQIGRLSKNAAFVDWAEQTYRLGVCQIDANGMLPLELDRGAYARNYHAYALRPLLATQHVLKTLGRHPDRYCPGAIDRLRRTTTMAIADAGPFARLTGLPQVALPDEDTYVSALRFNRLSAF